MLFIFCFKNLQFSWKMLIFAIGKFYQPLLMTLSISIQVGASCANLLFSLRIGGQSEKPVAILAPVFSTMHTIWTV